jgi:hypothetical protein
LFPIMVVVIARSTNTSDHVLFVRNKHTYDNITIFNLA